MTSSMELQRFGLTDTDVEANRAWWLAMPARLASRRPRRWRDLGYDEQRAVLRLPRAAA